MYPDGSFRGVNGEDAVLQPLQLRRLRGETKSALFNIAGRMKQTVNMPAFLPG